MGIWTRIRQNLTLKIVSLVAAILLYIFVQQERYPTTPRTLLANVEFRNKQQGYEVYPEAPRVSVSVIGPRPSVDRLKDGDIKAIADLSSVTTNQPDVPVRLNYELPKTISDIMLDTSPEFIKIQVFRQKVRKLPVEAIYKKEAPAGLKYGEAVIHPSLVAVRGREDRVNRIDKIVVAASPTEPRASIDGDFSVVAWDKDGNSVEGVTIEPNTVHVTVPQLLEPSEGTVIVNPAYADRPAPPYEITNAVVDPNTVKIIGTPHRVSMIHAIYTEPLFVHDLTATTSIDATLITPPDVQVQDIHGKPITRVKVTLTIAKTRTLPVPDSAPPTTPKRDGPIGQ